MKYWTDGEWLGFGPGAHSTVAGARWKNVSSTADYVQAIETGQSVETNGRVLTFDDRWREALMMALRVSDGIDLRGVRGEIPSSIRERIQQSSRA